MTTLQQMTDGWRLAVGVDSGLGDKTVKYDLKGAGYIFINRNSVSNDDKPADLTFTATLDDMNDIFTGKLNGMKAMMAGRLRVSSMQEAMALGGKLEALIKRLPRGGQ